MNIEIVRDKDTGKLRHFRKDGEVVPLDSMEDFLVAIYVEGAVGNGVSVDSVKESV